MSVTLEKSCLNALERAAEEVGHSPSKAEYQELSITPSATTIQRVCGSWNKAKEEADMTQHLANREDKQPRPPREFSTGPSDKSISHAELLSRMSTEDIGLSQEGERHE